MTSYMTILQNVSRSSLGELLKVFCLTLILNRGPTPGFPGRPRAFTRFGINYDR